MIDLLVPTEHNYVIGVRAVRLSGTEPATPVADPVNFGVPLMAHRRALIVAPLYDGEWLPPLNGSGLLTERLARRIATALVKEGHRAGLAPDILLAVMLVEKNRVGHSLLAMTIELGRDDIATFGQPERRKVLKALGAKLVLTEGARGMRGAIAKRPELAVMKHKLEKAVANVDVMSSMYKPMAFVRTGPAYTMTDGRGWMAMVGISIPLWRSKYRASVSEAQAMVEMSTADLDAMPDDGHRYELIDGVLIVSPAPRRAHQRASLRLTVLLDAAVPPGLELLAAPFDVVLSPGIPDKGTILTQISNFWFRRFTRLENHLQRLKNALTPLVESGDYDLIMIDCPPALGILTLNVFSAADWLLIPLQCEYYALEGLSLLMQTIDRVRNGGMNADLEILGIVMTFGSVSLYDIAFSAMSSFLAPAFTGFLMKPVRARSLYERLQGAD